MSAGCVTLVMELVQYHGLQAFVDVPNVAGRRQNRLRHLPLSVDFKASSNQSS